MSREIRRVSADWKHPKDVNGFYVPHFYDFPYNMTEIEEGLRDGWLEADPPDYGCSVMPQWPEAERTHYQMYETTSEGTPVSPVFSTPEEVARYCADQGVSAFARETAGYEHWLRVARGGFAPTAMRGPETGGKLVSGVKGVSILERDAAEARE